MKSLEELLDINEEYDSVDKKIEDATDNWNAQSGTISYNKRAEIESAIKILRGRYNNVKESGITQYGDIEDSDAEKQETGATYTIEFSDPIDFEVNEEPVITEESLEEALSDDVRKVWDSKLGFTSDNQLPLITENEDACYYIGRWIQTYQKVNLISPGRIGNNADDMRAFSEYMEETIMNAFNTPSNSEYGIAYIGAAKKAFRNLQRQEQENAAMQAAELSDGQDGFTKGQIDSVYGDFTLLVMRPLSGAGRNGDVTLKPGAYPIELKVGIGKMATVPFSTARNFIGTHILCFNDGTKKVFNVVPKENINKRAGNSSMGYCSTTKTFKMEKGGYKEGLDMNRFTNLNEAVRRNEFTVLYPGNKTATDTNNRSFDNCLDKIKKYRDEGTMVNLVALSAPDKVISYYWAAELIGWDLLVDCFRNLARLNYSDDWKNLIDGVDACFTAYDPRRLYSAHVVLDNGSYKIDKVYTFEDIKKDPSLAYKPRVRKAKGEK